MAIERAVAQKAPKYRAIITNELTNVEALVQDDEVALKVPGLRGIVRVPIEEWHGFFELVRGIGQAIEEKRQVEGAVVPLPWEQQSAFEQQAARVAESAPGFVTIPRDGATKPTEAPAAVVVVRDADTGQPVAEPVYGLDSPDEQIVPDPFPPRVHA